MDEVVEETAEVLEVAPPEAINHESEKQSETNLDQERANVQEKNWVAMRQRQDTLEKELKKKDEMLEKFMTMQLSQQQPQQAHVEPEEPDEDYISKGKVKSVAKKAIEPLEARLKELEARLESQKQLDSLNQLKRNFSDFEQVVTPESLAMLEETEPELARAMVASGDPYKMGTAVYKYLKATQNPAVVAQKQHSKEIDKKLAKNEKTVPSPMAYDKRPMAQAFKTPSKQEMQALYDEMHGYANLVSTVPQM